MNKITANHLARRACVYIRQSTPDQVQHNLESQRRQYGLVDHARALGWQDIDIIDDDLGISGSGTRRPGFERLLRELCDGQVGAVFSIEASRLARNGRDWHTLLEFCRIVGALLIDGRKSGFLFQTSTGLPLFPRNIARDSLHPILKEMRRESAGFHDFRRFREAVLRMSEARTLLINYWMGHADREMSRRYGKQLVSNIQWRQECTGKVGIGFNLLKAESKTVVAQFGQVLPVSEQQSNAA